MAALTVAKAVPAGITVLGSNASAGGDTFANTNGRTKLAIKNGSGAGITATINAPTAKRPADGVYPEMDLPAIPVTVAAGATMVIGPIPRGYNDVNGNISVSYSAVASVTVSAFEDPA